jgi:DNA-directed RNA polymerase specialized sigma24 family protein
MAQSRPLSDFEFFRQALVREQRQRRRRAAAPPSVLQLMRELRRSERLDRASQEILDLRDNQGLSMGEIGARLDLPLNTVLARLNRGRHRLRRLARETLEQRDGRGAAA